MFFQIRPGVISAVGHGSNWRDSHAGKKPQSELKTVLEHSFSLAKEKQVSIILTDDLTFSCFISSQLGDRHCNAKLNWTHTYRSRINNIAGGMPLTSKCFPSSNQISSGPQFRSRQSHVAGTLSAHGTKLRASSNSVKNFN